MPNLDTLLSFPTNGAKPSTAAERTPIPPRSSHILVTDTTDSPALFVLTHFLRASHAINSAHRSSAPDRKGKSRAHTKVFWLGCNSDGIVHLKNVARKSAVHLDEETRDGAFCYIDANAEVIWLEGGEGGVADSMAAMSVQDGSSRAEQSLHRLYGNVAEELANTGPSDDAEANSADWTSRNLIVVDDLTALAWALDPSDSYGQPVDVARQLKDWLGALTSLAAKVSAYKHNQQGASLAGLYSIDTDLLSFHDWPNRTRRASSP